MIYYGVLQIDYVVLKGVLLETKADYLLSVCTYLHCMTPTLNKKISANYFTVKSKRPFNFFGITKLVLYLLKVVCVGVRCVNLNSNLPTTIEVAVTKLFS